MDLLLILIILSLAATIVSTIMGFVVMTGGGDMDKAFSNPLMRARVGLQALTIILLLIALILR